MSVEENKALIRRLYDSWNRRELAAHYELYALDFVSHVGAHDMTLDQMKRFEAQMDAAFPDAKGTLHNMVAEGDRVAFQVKVNMTHSGPFMGVAPTANKVEATNTHIVRVSGGRMAEWWGTTDNAGLMQQIVATPSGPLKKS